MLEINLKDELFIFLLAIMYGGIIGLIYDLYKAIRYYTKPKKILSFIGDLIFWLIVTYMFFIFLFKYTDGIIRGFVVVGFLIGVYVYFKSISKYVFPILIKIFKLILRLIHEIIGIILYPFKKMNMFIKRRFRKVDFLIKGTFKDMKRYIKLIAKKK